MKLTEEQIKNWKRVLMNMGMIEFVVNTLTDEQIEKVAENIQKRVNLSGKINNY
jgi:ribosomal protein S13